MKIKSICFFILLSIICLPLMSAAETNPFEGLRTQLKACRTIVLEKVDRQGCKEMLARVKIMNQHLAQLFQQAKLDGEGNYISALQRDIELFRFQCALFEDGISDVGVVGSFGSLLKTFVKYKDFRAANGL